jgi:hypothetical protein
MDFLSNSEIFGSSRRGEIPILKLVTVLKLLIAAPESFLEND